MPSKQKTWTKATVLVEVKRWLWFCIGLTFSAFGIALITKANLGTSPISSVPYVLSLKFGVSLGWFTFAFNVLFVIAQAAILKRDFKTIQLLQVACLIPFSIFIDVGMWCFSFLDSMPLIVEFVALICGCALLGLGVAVNVAPGVLMVPGDGIVKVISDVLGQRMGTLKVIFDCSLMATSVVLSVVFFGTLKGIGAGTIIAAVIVGQFVNLYNRRLPLLSYIKGLRKAASLS